MITQLLEAKEERQGSASKLLVLPTKVLPIREPEVDTVISLAKGTGIESLPAPTAQDPGTADQQILSKSPEMGKGDQTRPAKRKRVSSDVPQPAAPKVVAVEPASSNKEMPKGIKVVAGESDNASSLGVLCGAQVLTQLRRGEDEVAGWD